MSGRRAALSSWDDRGGGRGGDISSRAPLNPVHPSILLRFPTTFLFSFPPARVSCIPIPPPREVLQHAEGRQDGGRERRRRRARRERRRRPHLEGWCADERLPADLARRRDPARPSASPSRLPAPRVSPTPSPFRPGRALARVRVCGLTVDPRATCARIDRSAPRRRDGSPPPSISPYCTHRDRSWR